MPYSMLPLFSYAPSGAATLLSSVAPSAAVGPVFPAPLLAGALSSLIALGVLAFSISLHRRSR